MIYGEALLLSKQILRTHLQIKRGFSGTSNFQKFPHSTFDVWPIPWIRTLPLPRSFRGSSAELPQISYNEMDVSFNMQFLYFLEGQLLIARILKYKNEISREWMIWRKRLHSICFRELPQKKSTKSLPRASATAVRYHFPSFMTQSCISLCRK